MAVSECGTLSLPGKYQLTQNLSGGLLPDGNYFDITADGVSLDLQGHTITGGAGAKLVST